MAQESENYLRARKGLVLFSGLLLLSLVVGIEQRPDSTSSLLPFQLKNPQHLPHVFAIILAYSIYNLAVSWGLLGEEKAESRIRVFDLFAVLFIAATILVYYIYTLLSNEEVYDLIASLPFVTPGFLLGAVVVISFVSSIFLSARLNNARNAIKDQAENMRLRKLLASVSWELIFNPKSLNKKKSISFNADGSIGEGANENEYRWEVVDGLLEIYKEDGALQNRFKLDSRPSSADQGSGSMVLLSTDPESADAVRRGISGQYIQPRNAVE